MVNKELRDFIEHEMQKRDNMSATAFAEMIGVAPSTITGYLTGKRESVPTLDVLRKLAHGTETDFLTVLTLAFPEIAHEVKIDPRARQIAKAIMKLSQETQDFVWTIIQEFQKKGGGNNNSK